ncbi:hypothetical protein [Microbacterium ureisolvens]|uniref:Uncharacterized protein n=1 Tax=Microbacterium ureisolvens TaxID=2781186 RepID=A0ABS7I0F7_9MICO|nr:hypothetical protein [Microbacterium ureisolvens]MBW9110330.1 hypothetical protein [Microbacterium ureisolvens]
MSLARDQAASRRPSDLIAQWMADATVQPSQTDLRTSTAYDALALAAAADYEAILLSPVAPIGTNSVVAPTSQDRTLTTIRGSEVVSDPTNVLALECARRLLLDPRRPVRLCTAHQVVRMQPVPPGLGHTRHFRLFSLADAGPGLPDDGFEVNAIVAQLAAYRRILDVATRTNGLVWDRPVASVHTDDRLPALADRAAAALVADQSDVEVRLLPLESAYYGGLRVLFGVHSQDGVLREWIDLGVFDWVAQLTSNRRQRFVASAIGLQLLPLLASGVPEN